MTSGRTMPPLTPPGKVNVVFMKRQPNRGSFSSTATPIDELKTLEPSTNKWEGEPHSEHGSSGSSISNKELSASAIRPVRNTSFDEREATRIKHPRPKPRSQSLSDPQTPPAHNPYTQHSYAAKQSPMGSISNVSLWMEGFVQRKQFDKPDVQFRNVLRSREECSNSSDDESIDSDQELEQMGLKIRSEIRQMEMAELALEAEKAANAGEDFFVGRPSTFGDDAVIEQRNTLLKPPELKLKRNRTEGSLKRPSLMTKTRSFQPKLKVSALRDVDEVIPPLGDLHRHLRSHFVQRGVDYQAILRDKRRTLSSSPNSDSVSVATSVGQSIKFLSGLKLWGTQHSAQNDTNRNLSSRRPSSENQILTPKKSSGSQEEGFSPNSLIDNGSPTHENSTAELIGDHDIRSVEAGVVGGVLAQHIAFDGRRFGGPIRVPSGLALPDIDAVSTHILQNNLKNAKRDSQPQQDAVESATVATAFSTPVSYERGTIKNKSSPFAHMDDCKESVTGGSRSIEDESGSAHMGGFQSVAFATPEQLKAVRGRHRRIASDGLTPTTPSSRYISTSGSFLGEEAIGLPIFDDKMEADAKSDCRIFSRRIESLTFENQRALSMRPLQNGLSELVGLDERGLSGPTRCSTSVFASNHEEGAQSSDSDINSLCPHDASNSSLNFELNGSKSRSSRLQTKEETEQQFIIEKNTFNGMDGCQNPEKKYDNCHPPTEEDLKKEATSDRDRKFSSREHIFSDQIESVARPVNVQASSEARDELSFTMQDDQLADVVIGEEEAFRDVDSVHAAVGHAKDHYERKDDVQAPLSVAEEKTDDPGCHLDSNPCECLLSQSSSMASCCSNVTDIGEHATRSEERATSFRRVMSLPSLTDATEEIHEPRKKRHEGTLASEPGFSTFASRFDVSGLKDRLIAGRSEPGHSTFGTRFDIAAKSVLRRLSSADVDGQNGLPSHMNIPVKENTAFLNNYLYCSKEQEVEEDTSHRHAASLCESGSAPCAEYGCGGLLGAVETALEIFPSGMEEKETFTLGAGSTRSLDDSDRWFETAVEKFDGALERLVGGINENQSKWNMSDFRAPSLTVKKCANKPHAFKPERRRSENDTDQLKVTYGRSRQELYSLPRADRAKAREHRSRLKSNGSISYANCDG